MKNFTRFLALTLAILFAVGTISVAATQFPDVDESNPYAKEIDVVSSMGIVTGAKGMFNDGKVARWQFTVYAAKALTGETSDDVWTKNENNTTFEDLASRTAPAAVSWAVSNDLIKGRSNTEFDPYTTITLAEASAIMVRALGYDYDVRYNAEQPNAWKWAYLTKAMELGVTKGLASDALSPDHELTKSEACLLIYNTLFITRKNGSTVADRIWGGVDVDEDAVAQQFIITAAKTANAADQLAGVYALHSFQGVKLNGFVDGKVDEDITLYLTSDEFKALTGVDAATVIAKGYVGASLDALYAADGQEIEELTLNTPTTYSGLVAGNEIDATAKTLTVNGVTYDPTETDFYVTHESEKGYPALRDPAVYKMSTKGQVVYGVGGQALVDYVGNKFFLDIDDNIVAENVHDTNSVAYIGVIVSGQYGKFASSAEIWVSDDSEEADIFDDGNYRVATDADLAKAALVDTVYEDSDKANEATFDQTKREIAYGKYTVTAFDDDGDGVADRIFINGTVYAESILRINAADKTVKKLAQGDDGIPYWTNVVTTNGSGVLSRNVRVAGTEIKKFADLNKASDNDFFIAMVPANGTIELVEWIPYKYGQLVNLAELVNPSSNYTTTAIVGIVDRDVNTRSDYFVDIAPAKDANVTNPNANAAAWKYYYNKVAVDVAADVSWLTGDPTSDHPTFADRSVLVSQWVKYIDLPVSVIKTVKDHKVTATETKDMILYIAKDTGVKYTNAIYVSSLVANETASFTFYDTLTGNKVTLDNVSLYDTIFNDNSLVWVKQLKSNLAIDSGDKNFAYVANPETASVDAYKTLEQLFADDTAGTVAEHYTLADPAAFDAGNEYFTFAQAGVWTQQEIDNDVPGYNTEWYYLVGEDFYKTDTDIPVADRMYYAITAVANPDVNDIATYYTNVAAAAVGHTANLFYLTFTKDNVGDFFTVKAGNATEWTYTNMTKDVEGYKVLQNYVYLKNAEANHANNKFYFVKDANYPANEVDGIIHTTDKYYTNFAGGHAANDEGAVTYEYPNETSKFTTAYKTVDDFSVYTVAAAKQIGQYWFSPGIEYSINAKTPVVGYDNNIDPITSTFDVVFAGMTAAQKKELTKTDRSFTVFTYTQGDNIQTTATSNTSNDASVIAASADAEYKIDGNKLFLYTPAVAAVDESYTLVDNPVVDDVATYFEFDGNDYTPADPAAFDANNDYYTHNDAVPYAPATLTAKGVLTSAQVAKFAKKITGYKATETFISVGNATEWNLADYITMNNATQDTYEAVANPVVDDIATYYEEVDVDVYELTQDVAIDALKTYYTLIPAQAATLVYLKKDAAVAVADFTAEELAKVMEVLTAADWSDEGTNGIVVFPNEVDAGTNTAHQYRYGYTVKGDTVTNLSFLKVSGVNYDGKAFSALMQIDGVSIGSVNDDTKFVVISAQDVKVADDKKSYTQINGYEFTSMNLSEISAATFKMAVYQYMADFAAGKSATYVFLYGYVIPGETGTVKLTELTNATVDGLELGQEKKLSVGEYTYTVTPAEGYPNIAVKVNGTAAALDANNAFKVKVEKDKTYNITINCTATPVDTGAVAVTVTKGKVFIGETQAQAVNNLPVGEYTFTVTPDEGYPVIAAYVDNELVDLDENNAFTLNVEKDQAYNVVVICSAVRYIFLKADFNSTVGYEGNEIWFTWTTGESVAYDVFTAEKINGAVYETYKWSDTNYARIYTGAGIYAVDGVESKFGTGKYRLVKGTNENPIYTTDSTMAEFLAGNTTLKTGAFFGSEMANTILFFDLGVTDYVYTAATEDTYTAVANPVVDNIGTYYELVDEQYTLTADQAIDDGKTYYTLTPAAAASATAKASNARRTSKQVEDFIFVTYTVEKGYQEVNKTDATKYVTDDPAAYNFLPWKLGDNSYATAKWEADPTATTEQLTALTGDNTLQATSVTFKYAERSDGKIIVFANTITDATLTCTK